ncbi:MAG: hypothetical protein Fur0037_06770 [Planctomycetota bacterium]
MTETRTIRVALLLLGSIALTAPAGPAGPADAGPQRPPAQDPYTGGAEEALAKAGYVSFGPFPFGTNHDSADVDALLPAESLIWIETAHFRIGASLSPCRVAGNREWIATLREELKRLGRRLSRVSADAKILDPWLRAHLVAQRAEEVYADVCSVLGVTDADFPASPGDDPRNARKFMGLGPFLGMPRKYSILLVRESASLLRYTAAYHGWGTAEPARHHDHAFGTAFFGAAEQSDLGLMRDDLALRVHLTFHLSWLLYTSYRSYGHNLPAWITDGLAHWHARRISTDVPIYGLEDGEAGRKRYAQWERLASALLRGRAFEPLPRLFARMDGNAFDRDEHLQSWALVDWLLGCQRTRFAVFLNALKDPFHDRLRFPTPEELEERQRRALVDAFGLDAERLEEAWRRQPVARAGRR